MTTLAIMRKELISYFSGPLVYVVIGAFLFATGYQFYTTLTSYVTFGFGANILENFWEDFFVNHIGFYLLIVVPLFTMRLLAEEQAALPAPRKPRPAKSPSPAPDPRIPDSFLVGKQAVYLWVTPRTEGATVTLRAKTRGLRKKVLVPAVQAFVAAKYGIDRQRVTFR